MLFRVILNKFFKLVRVNPFLGVEILYPKLKERKNTFTQIQKKSQLYPHKFLIA